jgi:hypothetical protein
MDAIARDLVRMARVMVAKGKPFAEINEMVRIDTQNMMWAQVKSFEDDFANVIGVTPDFGATGYRGKITKRDIKERISTSEFDKRFAGSKAKKITDAVFDAVEGIAASRVWKREVEDAVWRKEYKINSQDDFEDIIVILKMDIGEDKLYVEARPMYHSMNWKAIKKTAKLSTSNPKQVATWATKTWIKERLAEQKRRNDEHNAQRLDEEIEESLQDLYAEYLKGNASERGWEYEFSNGVYLWSSGRSERYNDGNYEEVPDDHTWKAAWDFVRAVRSKLKLKADVEQGDKGEVHVTVRT